MKRQRFSEERIVGILREAEKSEKPNQGHPRDDSDLAERLRQIARRYKRYGYMEVFYSLAEAQVIVEKWRQSCNNERPHSSLGYRTPAEFAAGWRLESRPAIEWEVQARMP